MIIKNCYTQRELAAKCKDYFPCIEVDKYLEHKEKNKNHALELQTDQQI